MSIGQRRSPPALSLLAAALLLRMAFQPPPHAQAAAVEGNFGVQTEIVPFELPAGPGMGAPELALVYSSSSNSGDAGVGWTLPYSRIQLDLRDGVPAWSLPGDYGRACAAGAECPGDGSGEGAADWEARILLDDRELVPSPADEVWDPGRTAARS